MVFRSDTNWKKERFLLISILLILSISLVILAFSELNINIEYKIGLILIGFICGNFFILIIELILKEDMEKEL